MGSVCGMGSAGIACALGAGAPVAAAMPPGPAGQAVRQAHEALHEVRIEAAERLLAALPATYDGDADVLATRALTQLYLGHYDAAVDAMQRSLEARPVAPHAERDERAGLLELMRKTRDVNHGYVETTSADGRFVVRHAPGPDAVLVPYALEVLRDMDAVLARDLGAKVPGPIRLEIYPTPETLAEVSSLSVAAIERTGTIALSKWDRLMITSPSALLRGYPWADTIAHELVHLVLTRATKDRAPVWFQEGMAKFFERSWRGGDPSAHLDPASQALLIEAAHDHKLIPFKRFYPSIALLPSQRDAALAFAQVSTFVERFYAAHGGEGLIRVDALIADGVDARTALAKVAGVPFAQLERRWRQSLSQLPEVEEPPRLLAMRFRDKSNKADDAQEVKDAAARRFLRLGDLLWARDRPLAAAREYERAHEAEPSDPIVASRFAQAALAGGDAKAAVRALEPVVERYPEHAPGRSVLAAALLATGDVTGARQEALDAILLNPFDPSPHCTLADSATDQAVRHREQRFCGELSGR